MGDGVEPSGDAADFGRWIRTTRGQLLLTQEELAELARVSIRTIQMLEAGRAGAVRPATRRQLVTALTRQKPEQAAAPGRTPSAATSSTATPSAATSSAARSSAATPSAPRAPAQLPRDVPAFAGRHQELRQLADLFGAAAGGNVVVVAITGPGGIGKSALAVRAAHRLRARFPDGQLYVDLGGSTPGRQPLRPYQALLWLLRSLGQPDREIPADPAEAAAWLRSMTAGRRLLIVLDNAEDSAQVRDLLPGDPSTAVIITSRNRLRSLDGASHLELGLMSAEEATDLLTGVVGERIAHEPDEVRRVVRLCGYLPLGLRIAAGRLASRPAWRVAELAGRLADQRHRLDELSLENVAVRGIFLDGYAALAHEDEQVAPARSATSAFRAVGRLDLPEICAETLAAYRDRRPSEVAEALGRLVEARLVEPTALDRYAVHDLLRLFARERAAAEEHADDHVPGMERLTRWYIERVHDADRCLYPDRHLACQRADPPVFPGRPEALAWLEAERRRVVALFSQITGPDLALADLAEELLCRLTGFFELRGYWHDWELVAERALELAEQRGHVRLRARGRHIMGVLGIHRNQRDLARPAFEEALRDWERLGDTAAAAESLNGLAIALREFGEYDEAFVCHERQLAAYEALGDRKGVTAALVNIAGLYATLGRYDEAMDRFRRCIGLKRMTGDRRGEGIALHGLGRMHRLRGDLTSAAKHLEYARQIFAEVDEVGRLGLLLSDLAAVYRDAGRLDDARRCLREILDLGRVAMDTVDLARVRADLEALQGQEASGSRTGASR